MKLSKYIEIRLIKFLVVYYTIVVLLSFFKKLYYKLSINATDPGDEKYSTITWSFLVFKNLLLDWFIVLVIMIFLAYITKKMIERKKSWKFIIIFHSLFAFLFSWVIFIMASLFAFLIGDISIDFALRNISFSHYINVLIYNFLIYTSMLGIIIAYYYLAETKQAQEEKANLSVKLISTKIQALKSQLHPHFLFNTLNSIHSLMDEDKVKSQDMLLNLSDLLREIVDYRKDNLIELQDEIKLLNKYLNILKIRFSDDLEINLSIHNNIDFALIPSMLLQPIIENCIKHGYSKENLKLKISITILREKSYLIILIQNNGKPLNEKIEKNINKGLGVKNTKERLYLLYKTNYSYQFYNSEMGVTTKIRIPYILREVLLIDKQQRIKTII